MNAEQSYKIFLKKLKELHHKELIIALIRSVLLIMFFISWLLFIVIVAEAIFRFPGSIRTALFWMTCVGIVLFMVYFSLEPLKILFPHNRQALYFRLARSVGDNLLNIKDRFLNAIQIYPLKTNERERYSRELIDESIENLAQNYISRDFTRAVTYQPVWRFARLFIGAAAVIIIISILFNAKLEKASIRMMHPEINFPVSPDFTFRVYPGNTKVIRGDSLTIQVKVNGEFPDEMSLFIKQNNSSKFEKLFIKKKESNVYSYQIDKISSEFLYFVEGIDTYTFQRNRVFTSPLYHISVVHRPIVRSLKVHLDAPEYSGMGSRYLEDNIGNISALKGTKVHLDITSNKDISNSSVVFNDETTVPLKFLGNNGTGDFYIKGDQKYHILLFDKEGITNETPIEYWITHIQDEFPYIELIEPQKDIELNENMKVFLYIKILDDFGFNKVRIAHRRLPTDIFIHDYSTGEVTDESEYNYIQLDIKGIDKSTSYYISYDWDLSELNLLPGDIVEYLVEVFDNDEISGPKKSATAPFLIRFPTINEIYAEMEKIQELGIEEMEEILEESRHIKEKLEDLSLELARDPQLDWEQQKVLENASEEQQEHQKRIEEIKKSYEELLTKIEQNDLVSLETMKKYLEVQQLFQELTTPEFMEAMNNLQKVLQEQVQDPKLQNMVKNMKFSQEEFLKKVERTHNILKQIQMEQWMDELVRMAESVSQQQKDINIELQELVQQENEYNLLQNEFNQETEYPEHQHNKDKEQRESEYSNFIEMKTESIARNEENLQQITELLKQRMEQVQENMANSMSETEKNIASAQEMMEQRRIAPRMGEMGRQIRKGDQNQAVQSGQTLQNDLQQLTDDLNSAREKMLQNQKEEIASALNKSAMDLISLSKLQELLLRESGDLGNSSSRFESTAEKQSNLLSGLIRSAEELLELSQKTFFVTPEMGQAIGQAMGQMRQSIQSLEARNKQQSAISQSQAMTSLNRALSEVRKSMQSLAGSESGSGLEEFLQRLERMAQQQSGINQQTEELTFGPQMGQRSSLLKMAAEQEALRKTLEQLMREMGNRSEILGRLDEISKDMAKVVQEIEQENHSRETINRQRRILSRLLDAQRSLQRRDYSRRRKSETGKEYIAVSPNELQDDLGESLNTIRQDLLQALEEGYTKDYENLIRRYFDALGNYYSEGALQIEELE